MVALGVGANRPGGNSIKLRYVDIDSYDGAALTPRHYLSSTSTISLAAGSDPNLSLVNGQIVTASAIPAGQTQTANIKEDAGGGVTATYPLVLRGKAVVAYAVKFGANTLRGWGGFDLQYKRGGNPVILLGNTGGAFAISNGKLVLAGTVGSAPPALNSTYVLVITDFAGWTAIAVVSRIDGARSIASVTEARSHGAAYGERVILRDGSYDFGLNRLANPTGTFTGANWCVFECDTGRQATLNNVYGNTSGGFKFTGLSFGSKIANAEAFRMYGHNYFFDNCYVTAPGGNGIMSGNAAVNNTTVQDCTITDTKNHFTIGRDDTISVGVTIARNYFSKRVSDAVQLLNCKNVLIEDNFSIDKTYDADAHPDFCQVFNNTNIAGAQDLGFFIGRRNVVGRGRGGDGGYAGDHGFFMSMQAGGPKYSSVTIQNNFLQMTNANAITITANGAVDVLIENNTAIYDPGATDLIGIGGGGFDSYPEIKASGTGNVTVRRNVVASIITASSTGGGTVINTDNLINQKTLADQQAIFANPYATGSNNDGIVPGTNYAARKADFTSRYQTIGAALTIGAFVPVTPDIVMNPYVLLDGFDSIGSRTVSSGAAHSIVAPVTQGTGALQFAMQGVANPATTNPNIGANDDPATWDLVAVCIDFGTDVFNSSLGGCNLNIKTNGSTYRHSVDTQYGNLPNTVGYPVSRGKRWLSYKASRMRVDGTWANPALTAAGAAAKEVSIQTINSGTNRNQTLKVDALIRPQRIKPAMVWTFDDVNKTQRTKAAPVMQQAGIDAGMPYPFVGTGFMAQGVLGGGLNLSATEAMELKTLFGWTWSLDSDPYDAPFIAFPTRRAAIDNLNAAATAAIQAGYCSEYDAKLLCYSFGASTYWGSTSGPLQAVSITPNGTDRITLTNTTVWGVGIAAGMVVKNTGATGNPVVVSALRTGSSTVELLFDRPIPASAARTFYFCATRRGLTYTANGSAQITVDTTYLVPGMTKFAYGIPAGLTIQSIDVEGVSGTVTMSGNVPSGSGVANFYLTDAEFAPGKMEDALLSEGYKFARRTSNGGGNGVYTGYGLDPLLAINMPAASIDDGIGTTASLNKTITELTEAYENGRDIICYMHYGSGQSDANFVSLSQWAAARCAAGDFDILALTPWLQRVESRIPLS